MTPRFNIFRLYDKRAVPEASMWCNYELTENGNRTMVLPKSVRKKLDLESKAIILGLGGILEIWNIKDYNILVNSTKFSYKKLMRELDFNHEARDWVIIIERIKGKRDAA